jgi:hypothetical protein
MSIEAEKTYEGHSDIGFSLAAQNAVQRYEDENGRPGREEPVTLKVLEMTVTFENPIRDYSVTIG